MSRWFTIGALLLAACGDNLEGPKDAAPTADVGTETLAGCLDRPTELLRPPAGELPCELLPPGFSATRFP